MTIIEKQINQFLSADQVAETTLSKVTPVLQQISQAITKNKRAAIMAETRVDNSSATIMGHVTSTSADLKYELKDYMDQKF